LIATCGTKRFFAREVSLTGRFRVMCDGIQRMIG